MKSTNFISPHKLLFDLLKLSLRSWWYLIKGCPVKLLSDSEVFEGLSRGSSLARWGDGETAIIRGKSIYYQNYHNELRLKLNEISNTPAQNLYLGVPWAIYSSIFDKRWNKKTFKVLFSTRIYWCQIFPKLSKNVKYTRTEIWWDYSNRLKYLLNQIFDKQKIIFIGSKKYINIVPKNSDLIEIPEKNCFDEFSNLKFKILEKIQEDPKSFSILIAAGPTAKALVNDLSNICQVVDVGHALNFALHGKKKWVWDNINRS